MNEQSSADDTSDIRPIIVAEHASARFGGEAILPLHYFRFLRQRGIEAWLVVHDRTRRELEETLPGERDRIFYVPDRQVQIWGSRLASRMPRALADMSIGTMMHAVTQYTQRKIVRTLAAEVGATVVHEPIPVSPKAPSMTYDMGVPVVIGPMNGGMTYPPGFPGFESRLARTLVNVAREGSGLLNGMVPGKRRAAALLVANQRTRQALPRGTCPRVIELVENGVDLTLFRPPADARPDRPRPRFVFLGRLVDWKGVDLLLKAVAQAITEVDFELHVVGDGVERSRLEELSRALALGDRVVFRGFVPQPECPAVLAEADALVLPSLYECGGAVVLEAMASGLPVVATRWGGPADYLDDRCGILIDPLNPTQFVGALAGALIKLARERDLRRTLGAEGRRRVEAQFDWRRKIDRIIDIYREVQRQPNPSPISA
jgi:glycosyltransferase involved in cell wall biosynthesis